MLFARLHILFFVKAFREKIGSAYRELVRRRYTTIAGMLSFFLVTSVMPFLFYLSLIVGKTARTEEILDLEFLGWARELLLFLKRHAENAADGAGIFFLLVTLWSSSGFFYHLRKSGEILYDAPRRSKGWKVRISAILFTFAVLFYVAVALALVLGWLVLSRRLPLVLSRVVLYPLLFTIAFFTAWLLNGYVCPYRVSPAQTVRGSLITAALWMLALAVFAVYLRVSNAERLYGALSAVILFLLFIYWMMVCFTAGAIYNCRRGNIPPVQKEF